MRCPDCGYEESREPIEVGWCPQCGYTSSHLIAIQPRSSLQYISPKKVILNGRIYRSNKELVLVVENQKITVKTLFQDLENLPESVKRLELNLRDARTCKVTVKEKTHRSS